MIEFLSFFIANTSKMKVYSYFLHSLLMTCAFDRGLCNREWLHNSAPQSIIELSISFHTQIKFWTIRKRKCSDSFKIKSFSLKSFLYNINTFFTLFLLPSHFLFIIVCTYNIYFFFILLQNETKSTNCVWLYISWFSSIGWQ